MEKLLFSVTFQEFTPESLEDGETSDNGFEREDEEFEFSELVKYLEREGFHYWSSTNPQSMHDWLTTETYTVSYETGLTKCLSIHPCNERSFRYLLKAAQMVGIKP